MWYFKKETIIFNGKDGSSKTEERKLSEKEIEELKKCADNMTKESDAIFKEFDNFMGSFSTKIDKMFSKMTNWLK